MAPTVDATGSGRQVREERLEVEREREGADVGGEEKRKSHRASISIEGAGGL